MYFAPGTITTNLYTKGKELSYVENGQEYVGYYFKTYTGQYYSGKNPNQPPNYELTKAEAPDLLQDDAERFDQEGGGAYTKDLNTYFLDEIYRKNTSLILPNTPPPLPKMFYPSPNEKQYELGEFQRYFLKKSNEPKFYEINKQTYEEYSQKQPTVDYNLYYAFQITWVITGLRENVFRINQNTVTREVKNLKVFGFNNWFKGNFTQFFKYSDNENLYTPGGEYIIEETGREYIGYYHIHPSKGAMEGRQHIEGKHRNLLPIVLKKRRKRFGDVGNSY